MFEMQKREKGCPVCGTQFKTGDHIFKNLHIALDDDHTQLITYVLCSDCGLCYMITYPPQDEWYAFYEKRMNELKITYMGDIVRSSRLYVDLWPLISSGEIKKVLSYGCGRGYLESHLSKQGVKVMGVDYRQPSYGDFEVIEPEMFMKYTLKPQFDWAIMIHCLEHLIDPLEVLDKIWRALIPGGHLLIEVPSFGHPTAYSISHPNVFNVYNLRELMYNAGFEIVGLRQLDVSNERVRGNTVLNMLVMKPEESNELLEETGKGSN